MLEIESEEQFNDLLADTDTLVVVDFWAEWCGPCKTFEPIFNEVAQAEEDTVFVKVNIEEVSVLAKEYNIRAIPSTVFIGDDGEVLDSHTGLMTKAEMEEKIDELG